MTVKRTDLVDIIIDSVRYMGLPCRLVRVADDRVEYEVNGAVVPIGFDELPAVGRVPRDIAAFMYERLSPPDPPAVAEGKPGDPSCAAGPLPVFAEFEFADGRRVVASGRTEGEARKKLAALVKTELAARSCARPCRRVEP